MEPMDYNAEESRSSKGAIITSFIVGLIVGVIGYWGIIDKGLLASVSDIVKNGESTGIVEVDGGGDTVGDILKQARDREQAAGFVAPVVVSDDNVLVVSDQSAGNTVVMSMVALMQSGWVAIHEETPEGDLGNILGARRFEVGKHFGEAIPLLRGTMVGSVYYAVLHADDGDSDFKYEIEIPVTTAEGESISAQFTVTSDEEEEVIEE